MNVIAAIAAHEPTRRPTPADYAIAEGRTPPDWYRPPPPLPTLRERIRLREAEWQASRGDLPWW
jgi:hypothetical protein